VIDNGANTTILAEYNFGAGKGYQNIAYFNCSTGIRTGAISAGTIVRTINDAEDAFGHMVIKVDGEPCSCGNYGCIDCYSSIYAIIQKYNAAG
jgi:predicted NBD/HSP70 family sugar kinase